MIYCFNSNFNLLGTFITQENISPLLKFCINVSDAQNFIITKNNQFKKIEHIIKTSNAEEFLILEDKLYITKNLLKSLNINFNKFLSIDILLNKLNNIHDFKNNTKLKKRIKMFGIKNGLNIGLNRGPCIQTSFKEKMFNRLTDIEIDLNNKYDNYHWYHYLNPHVNRIKTLKYSIGPNLDIFNSKNNNIEKFKDKKIVADSEWMKQYLIENFNINEKNIRVIPVFVSKDFYNTDPDNLNNDKFKIGLIGYYQNNDIKNLESLINICNSFQDIEFELLSSRNKNMFPRAIQNLKNLKFLNVEHDSIPNTVKHWNCYLGLSKRERGPAAIQEMKTIGIPTIAPNHTGYKEFNPLIKLDIKPFKKHDIEDFRKIYDSINDIKNNFNNYATRALKEKHIFWQEEKSEEIILNKWKNFFIECLKGE